MCANCGEAYVAEQVSRQILAAEHAARSGAYQKPDDVIDRALEVLQEQDAWLTANREAIDAKIRRGIDELNRGEGIPEDELDAHLERLKAEPE